MSVTDPEPPDLLAEVARPKIDTGVDSLFDIEQSWEHYWWGLPEFTAADMTPVRRLVVQFASHTDYEEFRALNEFKNKSHHETVWWPEQNRTGADLIYWTGTPSPTRYPVYIPSKGRADVAMTPALLDQAGVDYRLVVEPPEADAYRAAFGADKVLVLPFADLGQGSIPARNWIWEHAKAAGARWHWIIDDNINDLSRAHANRRLMVKRSSAPLRMVEDFADRYDNLAFAGLSAKSFVPDSMQIPLTLNTRVYSFTLINTAMDYRWRGRYNEDTDICLRALKDGWATALFRNFNMQKAATSKGDGSSGLKGGNTDTVYAVNDHRRSFAESLRDQHPDVVEVVWKFNRWHHQVDYSPFKRNELRLKDGVTATKGTSDYGLRLVRAKDINGEAGD